MILFRNMLVLYLTIQFGQLSYSQSVDSIIHDTWEFNFLMIKDVDSSITREYDGTFFTIDSDTTYIMGSKESQTAGIIKEYQYLYPEEYPYDKGVWTAGWSIIFISQDFLILLHAKKRLSLYYEIEGHADIILVYAKKKIDSDKKARKLYKKLKRYMTY